MERDEASQELSSTAPAETSDDFVTHKVTKLDTLAGLAIRYGVSVADIKRANGLLSDSAMFARNSLLIPKAQLAVGENMQVMVAQLVSGLGRDHTLNPDSQLQPASAAIARIARTLDVINGESYPADQPLSCKWLCQCGTCNGDMVGTCQRLLNSFEVEMTTRGGTIGSQDLPNGTIYQDNSSPHEMLRRRGHADSGSSSPDPREPLSFSTPPKPHSAMRPPRVPGRPHHSPSASLSSLPSQHSASKGGGLLSSMTRAVADSSSALMRRIVDVANQPALATSSHGNSMGMAADGVLASYRARSAGLRRNSGGTVVPGMAGSMLRSASGSQLLVKVKGAVKTD